MIHFYFKIRMSVDKKYPTGRKMKSKLLKNNTDQSGLDFEINRFIL